MQRLVQLALDFFDPPVAPAGPAAAPGVKAADSKPKLPPAPDGKAPVAPKTVVNRPAAPAAPAVPLPSLLSPAEFRHPQASREVLLGDAVVAYALQRARRRTILVFHDPGHDLAAFLMRYGDEILPRLRAKYGA